VHLTPVDFVKIPNQVTSQILIWWKAIYTYEVKKSRQEKAERLSFMVVLVLKVAGAFEPMETCSLGRVG